MPATRTHDLGFLRLDLPDSWTDHVVFSVHGPQATAGRASMTVVHERLEPGESLAVRVGKVLFELGRLGPLPRVVSFDESTPTHVAGRPAIKMRLVLAADPAPIAWTMVMIDPMNDPDHRMPVITCSVPADQASSLGPTFEAMLASIRIGHAPPSAAARPPPDHPFEETWVSPKHRR